MSDSANPADGKNALLDEIRGVVQGEVSKLTARLDEQDTKLAELAKPRSGARASAESVFFGGKAPGQQSGESALTSRGYSIVKLIGLLCGAIHEENAKVEMGLSQRLRNLYVTQGGMKTEYPNTILVPFGSQLMPEEERVLAEECRQTFLAGAGPMDPHQLAWAARQSGSPAMQNYMKSVMQTMSWTTTGSGGDFVPPAMQGEMIDIVRAREWMSAVGVLEVPFPPNGKVQMPKLTAGGTHYWVGENTAVTGSQPTTGVVTMQAKKHGILTTVPNELFRYSMPAFEGVLRNTMALDMAQGLGVTLLDGQSTSARPPGLDSISGAINVTGDTRGVTVSSDGDRVKPRLPSYMAAQIAMHNHDIGLLSYIMNPTLWDTIINLRADSGYASGDGQGLYLFRVGGRETAKPERLDGHLVVSTTQVRADLEKAGHTSSSGNDMTTLYAVIGNQLVLARAGVLEFALSIHAGSATFAQDQSVVRVLESVDFAAMHGDAICYCKYLAQSW